jgi:hypothetical protein
MRLLPNFSLRSPVTAQFLPSGRFFLRLVPLAPDLPAPAQAELAIEGLAPFPPAQLYWGCCVSPDRTSALVYAAHRRRFPAVEMTTWEQTDLVAPDVLPLLGTAPGGAGLRVLVTETGLSGAAWNGQAGWPVAVHARDYGTAVTDDHRKEFAAELAARAGLPDAPVTFLEGEAKARRDGPGLFLEFFDKTGKVTGTTALAMADQDSLDVRDRTFLDQRWRDRRRGDLVWKVMLGGLWAAAAAVALDLGAVTFRLVDRALQARVAAQAPGVAKLETAHALASRMDDLTHKRLRFFEMITTVNESRPASIQFSRTGTTGRNGLEIEAYTSTADDVGVYETALRKHAALEKVEVRDLRARDGVTTFGLSLVFKTETTAGNGGAP